MLQKPADTLAILVTSRLYRARLWREQYPIFEGASCDRWFEDCHKDYHKIYSDGLKQQHPDIYGFFGLTNLKIDAATAHLTTKYAHALDAPFVFEVSENPELNERDELEVTRQLDQLLYTGMSDRQLFMEPAGASRSVLDSNRIFKPAVKLWMEERRKELVANRRELTTAKARESAVYNQNYIKDQLMLPASGWNTAPVQFFKNLLLHPYSVMVGNEYRTVTDTVWAGKGIKFVQKTIPTWRTPDPLDIYIASDATTAQDGEGVTELLKRSRFELLSLREMEESHGYKASAIDELLKDHSQGSGDTNWMERSAIQSKRIALTDNDTFVCMVHQGLVSAKELSEHGVTGYGSKADEFYNATIEVCGNRTIRLELVKTADNRRNYFSSSFSGSNSYAGQSVAMKLHERQTEINILMFAKAENQWNSSGPNIFPNVQFFDDVTEFQLKPWSTTNQSPRMDGQAIGKPLETYQPTAMFRQHMQEVRELMIMADEECGIPSMISGTSRGGVSNTTLGGAVLQQTNGEAGMEAATYRLDKSVFEPMFTQLHYSNLMDKSGTIPAEYKRGDLQVVGRGIYGKKRQELQRREMLQMRPMLDADAQIGIIPSAMHKTAIKQMYAGGGFDVSGMQGGAASSELHSLSNLPKKDARTYTPEQQTLGAFQ
jgi:hypothetical protein